MERTLRDDLKWAVCVLVGVTVGYFVFDAKDLGLLVGGPRWLYGGDPRAKHSPTCATGGRPKVIVNDEPPARGTRARLVHQLPSPTEVGISIHSYRVPRYVPNSADMT
jgi:hypothetical protein